MLILFHPSISALALFQSTQLNLFERFLTQAVSGIDSTSITSGMQNVAYIVLLIGFLWQIYQSAMHGGDVRGLGTNLVKYVATAIVVMNYHAVFTTINQGFVNAGNWINSASGTTNLLQNWGNDLQTQFNQVGFQKLWDLISAGVAGFLDAILIIVAYILYPVVIVISDSFTSSTAASSTSLDRSSLRSCPWARRIGSQSHTSRTSSFGMRGRCCMAASEHF